MDDKTESMRSRLRVEKVHLPGAQLLFEQRGPLQIKKSDKGVHYINRIRVYKRGHHRIKTELTMPTSWEQCLPLYLSMRISVWSDTMMAWNEVTTYYKQVPLLREFVWDLENRIDKEFMPVVLERFIMIVDG